MLNKKNSARKLDYQKHVAGLRKKILPNFQEGGLIF
jgi:hypothetical protein